MLLFLDKHCVALCVDNMQRVQELSPIELVEMFVTVFCFLKDSSEVSQTLLDDFRRNSGYEFLTHFLLRLVQSPPSPYTCPWNPSQINRLNFVLFLEWRKTRQRKPFKRFAISSF